MNSFILHKFKQEILRLRNNYFIIYVATLVFKQYVIQTTAYLIPYDECSVKALPIIHPAFRKTEILVFLYRGISNIAKRYRRLLLSTIKKSIFIYIVRAHVAIIFLLLLIYFVSKTS
jgi:hypothetical protein